MTDAARRRPADCPRDDWRLVTDDPDGAETATWRALGIGVRLVVFHGELETTRAAVADVLDRVDRAYSRFRDDSEIVYVNRHPGESIAISPLLTDAIAVALEAARRTEGAVDLTVGRAMRAIGYDVDFDLLTRTGRPIELRLEPIPGWQSVDLSSVRREIRLRRGVELDLGSTGKAFAADLAAAAAFEAVRPPPGLVPRDADIGVGVLVSLGGDIATAGTAPPGGWRILVSDDSDTPTDSPGEVVAIAGGAIATSSTTVRRWQRGDRLLHHLVDPRTGGPVESTWRTASVAASTCVDANTAATAAIILGAAAVDWLAGTALPARLVSVDGDVVRVNGWPDPIEDAAPPPRHLAERCRPRS
jgi:thiamine biosynthesis lipoprotein